MELARSSEVLETVGRRSEMLDFLASGVRTKGEVVEALPVSRSTVDRGISELIGLDLVERREGGFASTTAGQLAGRHYREAVAEMAGLLAARPLLRRLDPAFDPPLSLFREATVVTVDEDPRAPARFLIERVASADRVRGLHGPFRAELPSRVRDALVRGECEADFVFGRSALDWLDAYHGPDLAAALDTGNVTIGAVLETPSYGLLVCEADDEAVDEREVDRKGDEESDGDEPVPGRIGRAGPWIRSVTVSVHGGGRAPVGVIHSRDMAAVEWAESVFEAASRRADPYAPE